MIAFNLSNRAGRHVGKRLVCIRDYSTRRLYDVDVSVCRADCKSTDCTTYQITSSKLHEPFAYKIKAFAGLHLANNTFQELSQFQLYGEMHK